MNQTNNTKMNKQVISRRQLEKSLGEFNSKNGAKEVEQLIKQGGLVLRTNPNPESKSTTNYSGQNPAYLTLDAIQYITDKLLVKHLMVDLPSVDREEDEGKLSVHCYFWNFDKQNQRPKTGSILSQNTITEFCWIKSSIPDGIYVCYLEIAPFNCDAAPSRPILYPVNETMH